MKKILLLLILVSGAAFGQNYPSPTFKNLTVNGILQTTTPPVGDNSTRAATTNFVALNTPCVSIMAFGGNNANTASNNAALAAAIAANPPDQICVQFIPGEYMFSGQATITLPSGASLTLKGTGADNTYLHWPANGGLFINVTGSATSVHLRDFTALAGSTINGDAITLNQVTTSIPNPANTALSDITNVTCRGDDGYGATNHWADCVTALSVSNINFTNLMAFGSSGQVGNGVQLTSTASAPGVVYNFQGSTFNDTQFGIFYGPYIQGVSVNQSNFTGGQTGIVTPPTATTLDQLTVTNSQFNTTISGITEFVNVPGTQITGNLFGMVSPGCVGIAIAGPGLYTITGNNFGGNLLVGEVGINFTGTASSSGVITGNVFYRLPTGINISSATGGANVQSNAYNSNTTNVNVNGGVGNTVGGGSP